MESGFGEKDAWNTLPSLLALQPDLRKWMDGWMEHFDNMTNLRYMVVELICIVFVFVIKMLFSTVP